MNLSLQKEVMQLLLKKKVFVNERLLKRIKSSSEEELINIKKNIETDKFENEEMESNVEVIFSHSEDMLKKEVNHFVQYFKKRYEVIYSLLKSRPELHRTLSIMRVLQKKESELTAIIGMVEDKIITKNGNIMITLEDPTGSIKVLVNKQKKELFEEAKDIVNDEVIGVVGNNKDIFLFANSIYLPEVPLDKELKKSPDEVYAAFISDLHIGSSFFLHEKFEKFLKWINGGVGSSEQRELVKKIKYLFIPGDLVSGVGIYPDQEKESTITDIYKQYEAATILLKKIPSSIKIILCPGNHDAVRLSEPQPPIPKDMAPGLHTMPNMTLVSNPCLVRIHRSNKFPGFDVLLYHGYSFDYYVANVDSIRNGGGYHRADLIMKFLLKRRHLAPSHTSTLYIPNKEYDPLVIHHLPDIFVSGHLHYSKVAHYRNITMICGSCWEGVTDFQIKTGHDPEPARVPIINLQTREVKILKF